MSLELEEKYLVLKWADIEGSLASDRYRALQEIIEEVTHYRRMMGKPVNRYVVINQDEPYLPDVLKILEQHGGASERV